MNAYDHYFCKTKHPTIVAYASLSTFHITYSILFAGRPCSSSPCIAGNTLRCTEVSVIHYTCQCRSGYRGRNCQTASVYLLTIRHKNVVLNLFSTKQIFFLRFFFPLLKKFFNFQVGMVRSILFQCQLFGDKKTEFLKPKLTKCLVYLQQTELFCLSRMHYQYCHYSVAIFNHQFGILSRRFV